jgi:hypothetical protein
MVSLTGFISRLVGAPFRWIRGRARPETGWDLAIVFIVYLAILVLLSVPFVILDWPASGWAHWPS